MMRDRLQLLSLSYSFVAVRDPMPNCYLTPLHISLSFAQVKTLRQWSYEGEIYEYPDVLFRLASRERNQSIC